MGCMDGRIVISTYPDQTSAEDAARHLVGERRLAACVNLVKIKSFYIWKKFEESEEYLAIYKTTEKKVRALKKAVEARHPYEVPEVVEISMSDVNSKYLSWLKEVTGDAQLE